jgi:hypothetical protein
LVTHPMQEMMIEKSFNENTLVYPRTLELAENINSQALSGSTAIDCANRETMKTTAPSKLLRQKKRSSINSAVPESICTHPKADSVSAATTAHPDDGLTGKSNPPSRRWFYPTSSGTPLRLWLTRTQGIGNKPQRNISARHQTRWSEK